MTTPATTPPAGAQPTPRQITTAARLRLPDVHDPQALGAVAYTVVLVIAGIGGTQAAMQWLGWHWVFAAVAVLTGEVYGVYLLALADQRRRLGEQAIAARVLSAAIAAGMVTLNYYGHIESPLQAGAFAGASALGYLTWLIRAGNRRRDQLRADRRLPEPSPVYGLVRWVASPWETWQARSLAREQPELGLYGSIDAVRLRRRLGKYVRQRVKGAHDSAMAEAVLAIYSPERLAADLAQRIDWGGLAGAFAAELNPAQILASSRGRKSSPQVSAAPSTSPAPVVESPTKLRAVAANGRGAHPTIRASLAAVHAVNHSDAAIRNAAIIRERWPEGLPQVGGNRLLRSPEPEGLGWSGSRATAALRAYEAGADRALVEGSV